MNWAGGIVVFVMIWWTVIFIMLPIGNKQPEKHEAGMAYGAPANANLKKKLIATTIVTILLWFVVYACMEYKVIDFREGARAIEATYLNTDTE